MIEDSEQDPADLRKMIMNLSDFLSFSLMSTPTLHCLKSTVLMKFEEDDVETDVACNGILLMHEDDQMVKRKGGKDDEQ